MGGGGLEGGDKRDKTKSKSKKESIQQVCRGKRKVIEKEERLCSKSKFKGLRETDNMGSRKKILREKLPFFHPLKLIPRVLNIQ